MLILRIFQLIAVIGTILTGMLSLFWPKTSDIPGNEEILTILDMLRKERAKEPSFSS